MVCTSQIVLFVSFLRIYLFINSLLFSESFFDSSFSISFSSVYLNDFLGTTSYPIKCCFRSSIHFSFILILPLVSWFIWCARVASYQNLSFCWTVPSFHKFHLMTFSSSSRWLSLEIPSWISVCLFLLLSLI